MSKNKLHYNSAGYIFAIGEYPGSGSYLEVDADVYQDALNSVGFGMELKVEDGELVIKETYAARISKVRQERDSMLAETDILRLKLYDQQVLTGEDISERMQSLVVYRQALRDITLQDPFNVEWPVLQTNEVSD